LLLRSAEVKPFVLQICLAFYGWTSLLFSDPPMTLGQAWLWLALNMVRKTSVLAKHKLSGLRLCLFDVAFVIVSEVEKGLLSDVASLASLVGLYDGWLGRPVSSRWTFTMRKSRLEMDRPQGVFLPLKPYAVLERQAWAMLKGGGLLADGQTWCSHPLAEKLQERSLKS